MKTKNRYISSFDGIRSFALLSVVFYHLFARGFKGGYLGVVIFFVLAGFLSMEKTMKLGRIEKGRAGFVAREFLKKLSKLYPALIFMLLVVSATVFLMFKSQFGHLSGDVKGAVLSVNNYSQLFSGASYFENSGALKPFTHIWALSLEIQVYLLIYAFFHGRYEVGKKFKWFVVLSILSLLSYGLSVVFLKMGFDYTRIYYSLSTRLYSFTIGAVAAFFSYTDTGARELLSPKKRDLSIFLLFLFLLLPVFLFDAGKFVFYLGFFLYSLLTGLMLILLSTEHSFSYRFLSKGIFKFLTKRAYHIYLWHFPIIAIEDRFFANTQVSKPLYYFIFFASCFVLSEISYRLTNLSLKSSRSKSVSLVIILLACGLLLVLPYKKIAENTEENKKLMEMKEQIIENEKKQWNQKKERTEKQKKEAMVKKKTFLSKEVSNENTETTGTEELEEKSPLLRLCLSHIDWVNNLNDEFLYLDPDEYEKYKDIKGLLIGDSIASMSYHTLATYMPEFLFDSEHSRQMSTAYEAYGKYKDQDFGKYLILSLGSNGESRQEDIDKIHNELKGRKLILLSIVLPYKDEEESRNQIIRSYAAKYDDVYLVDWYKAAKNRPEIFFDDKIHPGEDGAKILGQIIMKKMIEIEKKDKKSKKSKKTG